MADSNQSGTQNEIARLREALDAETRLRTGIQTRMDLANAEFEEFVSLAAHNLREPLRDVAVCSQLIAEAADGRLDAADSSRLERIQEGAVKMQSLLADVVDYWAAGAGGLQSSPTDMEAALSLALLSADREIAKRGAIVTHDPLPRVYGDSDALTRVLRHLIGNAIEYCDAPSPRIHISARRENPVCVFSVQDNGPGIDPAFQDRIFGAFNRDFSPIVWQKAVFHGITEFPHSS